MTAVSTMPAPAPTVAIVRARVRRRRRIVVVTGVLLSLVVVAAISLSVGDYALAPGDLWRTLWGGGERIESYVVFQLRAPRLSMAIVAGAALGVSGALLQSLLSNPLASPDLLGISGGAGVAAVFGILVLGITGPLLAVVAFVGGLVVAAFLLLAGSRRGDGEYRLVVAGIGVAFLCVAITGYLMTRAQVELAQAALIWLTGSLASTPWWNVAVVLDRLGGRSARDPRVRAVAASDPAGRRHRRLARGATRCRPDHHRRRGGAADVHDVRVRRTDLVHRAVRSGDRAPAPRARSGRHRHERRRRRAPAGRRRSHRAVRDPGHLAAGGRGDRRSRGGLPALAAHDFEGTSAVTPSSGLAHAPPPPPCSPRELSRRAIPAVA